MTQQAPYPDLVLLDLDLPDGNGLDFFEQVVSDVPVLAMTASTEADLARQLQALRRALRHQAGVGARSARRGQFLSYGRRRP